MVVSAPLIWLLFRGAKGRGISRRVGIKKIDDLQKEGRSGDQLGKGSESA